MSSVIKSMIKDAFKFVYGKPTLKFYEICVKISSKNNKNEQKRRQRWRQRNNDRKNTLRISVHSFLLSKLFAPSVIFNKDK